MKKIYIQPKTAVYECTPIGTLLDNASYDATQPGGGSGADEPDVLSKGNGGMWEHMNDED